jgi:hypothetical protein
LHREGCNPVIVNVPTASYHARVDSLAWWIRPKRQRRTDSGECGSASTEVLSAAKSLASDSTRKDEVKSFLEAVRAA